MYISADPGLGQGRGGAWDHRRCGTSPSSLSKVKPISQPASCPKATSRKHFPGMLRPPVKTSRHLDMKITCFGQVRFPPEGFVCRFCLSRLLLRFPRSNPSRSQPAGARPHHVNIFLACFVLPLRLLGIWT